MAHCVVRFGLRAVHCHTISPSTLTEARLDGIQASLVLSATTGHSLQEDIVESSCLSENLNSMYAHLMN